MMNPEIKQKWIEALRSGDYKQGKSTLKDCQNHYCCLGVLAEVAGFEDEILDKEYPNTSDACRVGLMDEAGTLPRGVYDESGQLLETLAEANDAGLSFMTIASIIEEQL